MRKFNNLTAKLGLAAMMAMTTVTTVFADTVTVENQLTQAVKPVANLIYDLLNPALVIVGAVGALYCVILGVKYAKCEEPQEREKAKGNLKNAIIGFVLIFVLMVLLKLLMPVLTTWASTNMNTTISDTNNSLSNYRLS